VLTGEKSRGSGRAAIRYESTLKRHSAGELSIEALNLAYSRVRGRSGLSDHQQYGAAPSASTAPPFSIRFSQSQTCGDPERLPRDALQLPEELLMLRGMDNERRPGRRIAWSKVETPRRDRVTVKI
jgi:hypothetical protein